MGKKESLEAFDATISDIYEAALNPAHWDVALTAIASNFAPMNADVGMLLWERVSPPAGRFLGATGVNEFARQGFLSFFAGQTPWSIAGHNLPVGAVAFSDNIVPREQFKQSPFYQDFLKNWGIEIGVISCLDRIGSDHLGVCFAGTAMYDMTDLTRNMRRLVPHLQRAARISRRIGEADLRAANAEAALNQSPSAIFCLGSNLELLHANHAAEKILSNENFFIVVDNKLRANRPEMHGRLTTLAQSAEDDAVQESARAVSLQFERDGLPQFYALAMIVDATKGHSFEGSIDGMKIMIVGGAQHNMSLETMDHLRSWFDLTPAEARLAAWISTGGNIEDFVRMRGVSINAGRFLLKAIFSKTGVNRQSELVALLHEVPMQWIKHSEKNPIDDYPAGKIILPK
ncbi:hypothetical protein LPB140_07660 [Sphingorhabdus lutea]|uniref:HTH luxR-type domain-containing protein n=1 Tax=Sphingorhabdus lutea TaxID=1913578 RepID=A0A1L3JC16_9SPHN|nr:helix-turn-helix transcriptional regulator [Sphingorhabdus lutea]APG62687.1 hypothetical protein LPB140_07660 [Sphingorhabdus lutea]